ncbi:MAG TPA: ATP phosphoribosyltransferase [Firmicutes bacterium]|jgi:ATP phosphoribosyltransferase|nr:ATP phosphoribosyltransferase [Bacillota bacterium]
MDAINIALPKGRLLEPSLTILRSAGVPIPPSREWGRAAVITLEKASIRLLIIRDDDVPTYVTHGAADLGIVGKDVLMEAGGEFFELFDLKEGFCRLVVAVPAHLRQSYTARRTNHLRVVTKYPRTSADYFRRAEVLAEIITVQGATELAPRVGLADVVVDLVATGRTLQENNLVEVEEIATSTARLVANPVSYRLKSDRIWPLVEKIRAQVDGANTGGEKECGS